MRTFHDVIIYSGTTEVTTSSRLEIASKSGFLAEIFSEQKECDGCKEATVLIFPEEDPTTLKEAFDLLSHFKSSFSIIQNPLRVNMMLSRLCSTGSVEDLTNGEKLVVVRDPSGPSNPAGENQQLHLSEALDRIIAVSKPEEKSGMKNRLKEPANFSEMIVRKIKDGNENILTPKKEKKTPVVLTSQASEGQVKTGKTGKFRCQICKVQEFSDRKRLYRHYSYIHYKKEILQLIGGKKEKCPFCEKQFRDPIEIVGHVGCTHKKIEDFLPERFHIKLESSKKTSVPVRTEAAKNSMEFVCGLCKETKAFNKRGDLYAHYSCVHYKAQLRPYIDEVGDKCNHCDLIHKEPTVYKKIRHLGVVHGMINNFLPQNLRLPKINAHLEAVQVKPKTPSTNENEISSDFHCHLCPFIHQRKSKLYCHYAISHYREQLLAKINVKKLDCNICGEKKNDLDSLLTHLGNTHGMVKEFLPAGYNLSRYRHHRNSSKTPTAPQVKVSLPMSPSSGIPRRNDYNEMIQFGVKKVFDKSEPGTESIVNKVKFSCDDAAKEEEDALKKKMKSIFGDSD